jgi:hypothetical protein
MDRIDSSSQRRYIDGAIDAQIIVHRSSMICGSTKEQTGKWGIGSR